LQADKDESSDDELINVVSLPGTPSRSRAPSRPASRPPSPTKGASARPAPGPLHLPLRKTASDPLKALPTELGQRVFRMLEVKDLARCARVSKKWCRSQTINYVWFQHYRKENFHDESLPPGKWTRRESKQNWRTSYMHNLATRSPPFGPVNPSTGFSSHSGSQSGYQTPREVREDRWRLENDTLAKPSKQEMRDSYKELGGRKVRGKGKISAGGIRDRGGWEDDGEA